MPAGGQVGARSKVVPRGMHGLSYRQLHATDACTGACACNRVAMPSAYLYAGCVKQVVATGAAWGARGRAQGVRHSHLPAQRTLRSLLVRHDGPPARRLPGGGRPRASARGRAPAREAGAQRESVCGNAGIRQRQRKWANPPRLLGTTNMAALFCAPGRAFEAPARDPCKIRLRTPFL